MRIAHLSDFHYINDFTYSNVMESLNDDLKKFNSDIKIDAVCITGDIFNRGDTSSARLIDAQKFIEGFLCGLDNPKLIFCPGNHDVNLKKMSQLLSAGLQNYKNIDDMGGVIRSEEILPHLADYISFTKKLNKNHYEGNNFYHHEVFEFNENSIGIVSLNSSWLSNGGGEKDRNQLMVCREQIEDAYLRIKKCDIKIAMMHHTFEWLTNSDKKYCELFLHKNFDLLLNGHNHDNSVKNITDNYGELAVSNTASLFNERNKYHSYNIIDIEKDFFKIYAREFYQERGCFDQSLRFSDKGEVVFKRNFSQLQFNVGDLIKTTDRHNEILLSHTNSTVAPKTIKQIFVSPPISDKSILEISHDNDSGYKIFNIEEISSSTRSIAFIGRRETGRSTLLNYIAVDKNKDFNCSSILGFVVDCAFCKETEASILEECTKFYESEIKRSDVKNLFETGKAVLCFDNYDRSNSKMNQSIDAFLCKYPNNRYVFGLLEEDLIQEQRAFLSLRDLDVYFIHPYGKKHTNKLAVNWFGSQCEDITFKLNSLESLLSGLKMPRTPFLVSALLWVIENSSSAKNIVNHAAAIDLLIDGLLEKIKDTNLRKSSDVHDQKHFLTKFARELYVRKELRLSVYDFEIYVSDYFRSRMLSTSSFEFSDALYRKGLLFKRDGYVSFKFDCFRAYFLSRNFLNDSLFLEEALRKENIVSFTSELDYYSGLLKDNSNVLLKINEITKNLIIELNTESQISLADVLHKTAPQKLNEEDKNFQNFVDVFESDSTEGEVVSIEMDLESVDKTMLEEQTKLFDPFVKILGYTRVISNINRNLELIDDPQLKINSFENIVKLWSLIFLKSYSLVEKSNEIVGDRFDKEKTEFFKKMASVLIPQTIVTLMAESLANPKMDLLYSKVIDNLDESFDNRLMCVILSSEAGTKGWIENIQTIMSGALTKQSKEMLAQVLFFRLLTISFTKFLSLFEKNKIQDIAGDLFIIMNGFGSMKKEKQDKLKNSFKQNINRRMLNYLE